MGGAISISSNNDTNEHLIRLWREVSAFEEKPSMEALNYPPHFTFAIYAQVDMKLVQDAVNDVFRDVGRVRITFDSIRYFVASPLVLWASPQDTSQLAMLHAALHKRINPISCHEHYKPDAWIPHCTLGTNIGDTNRAGALEFTKQDFSPFDVMFDSVDCISFPPVNIASRLTLGQNFP